MQKGIQRVQIYLNNDGYQPDASAMFDYGQIEGGRFVRSDAQTDIKAEKAAYGALGLKSLVKAAISKTNPFALNIKAEIVAKFEVALHIFDVTITKNTLMTSAPCEMGTRFFDNKVLLPQEITITGVIKNDDEGYADQVIEQLNKMRDNRKPEFYCVSTKKETFKNLVCIGFDCKNDREHYDAVPFTLRFKECLLPENDGLNVRDPANADYVYGGNAKADEIASKMTEKKEFWEKFMDEAKSWFTPD